MEECRMHNDCSDRCEAQTIGQCKGGGKEKWRVVVILFKIKSEIRCQDPADVVVVSGVVPTVRITHGKMCGVPVAREVDGGACEPEENNGPDESVCYSMPRRDQWTVDVAGDLGPVKL